MKYDILNTKQLENAFYQAKSYALRLGAKLIILSSSEGIWIFEQDKKNKLSNSNYINYTWNDLSNTDNFFNVINSFWDTVETWQSNMSALHVDKGLSPRLR